MSFSDKERRDRFIPGQDIRPPLRSLNDPGAVTIELHDRDVVFQLEKERLIQPLLLRAGIIDLNKAFVQMPQDLISRCGRFPRINGAHFFPYFHDLREETYRILDRNEYRARDYNHKHFLYPVLQGGFIADLADTTFFQRLFGVHQLGPNRHYPLLNDHNRGEHSIYFTVNMVRTLQSLDEENHELLIKRFRGDFLKADLISPEVGDEEVLFLACDLMVVGGMLHDGLTPAGGDTFKYLLGMDEEENLRWFLFEDKKPFRKQREEVLAVLEKRGLGRKHLQFVIDCICGQSGSLLGEMIHPEGKDQLDWDRIAYTLLDGQTAGFLYQEIPKCLLPKKITLQSEQLVVDWLDSAIDSISRPEISACLGIPLLCAPRSTNYPVVPTNFIDPSENWCLDSRGNLVCTDARKLLMVTAIRVWMIGLHYAGFKMLGIESEIQQRLKGLMRRPNVRRLLSRENILLWNDEVLWSELKNIEDDKLREILTRRETIGGTTMFDGKLVDENEPLDQKAFASYPVKMHAGLMSLVLDKGMVMTLEEYIQKNLQLSTARIVEQAISAFYNKRVVIYKMPMRK